MKHAKSSCLFVTLALSLTFAATAGATDYTGPIADYWASTAPTSSRSFRVDAAPWITPLSAPSNWVSVPKAFSGVGVAMKTADFGAGANEHVFLRTSVDAHGVENMDSINLQDTTFFVPPDQVKSLTIISTATSDVVTAIIGQQPGGGSGLRLLNLTMTGMAAGSLIARRPVDVVTGTVLVFNYATNTFVPIPDSILEMTLN